MKIPWQERAACLELSKDAKADFYPEGSTEERAEQEARALRVCRSCDVSQQCLEQAIAVREVYGVWGGTTEKERSQIFRSMVS